VPEYITLENILEPDLEQDFEPVGQVLYVILSHFNFMTVVV